MQHAKRITLAGLGAMYRDRKENGVVVVTETLRAERQAEEVAFTFSSNWDFGGNVGQTCEGSIMLSHADAEHLADEILGLEAGPYPGKVAIEQNAQLRALLPASTTPDGGNVSIVEQFRRMAEDAARWREDISAPVQAATDEQAYAESGYRHVMSLEGFKAFRADCAALHRQANPAQLLGDLIGEIKELTCAAHPSGYTAKEARMFNLGFYAGISLAVEKIAARKALAQQAEAAPAPLGEVMAKPDNEHGTLTWPRVVWRDGLFALPPVGTKLYSAPVAPAPTAEEPRP